VRGSARRIHIMPLRRQQPRQMSTADQPRARTSCLSPNATHAVDMTASIQISMVSILILILAALKHAGCPGILVLW
jgi:hypothetical protein